MLEVGVGMDNKHEFYTDKTILLLYWHVHVPVIA